MTTFGKYELERQIAKGGMAEIHLAAQRGPAGFSKQLVIKRILPELAGDAAFITMFLDEARLAARLSHPNIVTIHELGEQDGSYYIAMEYVRGPNLRTVIRRLRELEIRMPLHFAAWVVSQVAAGLAYAHGLKDERGTPLNLVHRDMSPDNVLVTDQGAVKMIDFGVAKACSNETKTVAGTVKGKFRYMSPEQVAGKPLDGRSDLFSLGIALYELATLSPPFWEGSDLATVSAIMTEAPKPPSSFVEGFPDALARIIDRALQKDPAARYETAAEMQADLDAFVHSRGQYLSPQEVGRFVGRLFSDSPEDIEALRALPSGVHTNASGPPPVPIAPSSVSATVPPPEAPPPLAVRRAVAPAVVAAPPAAAAPRKTRWIALGIVLLMVFGGGGFALWRFVLAPSGDEPATAVTHTAETHEASLAEPRELPVPGRRRGPEELAAERSAPEFRGPEAAPAAAPAAVAPLEASADGPSAEVPVGESPSDAVPDVPSAAGEAGGAVVVADEDEQPLAPEESEPPAAAAAEETREPEEMDAAPAADEADEPVAAERPRDAHLTVQAPPRSQLTLNGKPFGTRVNRPIQLRPGRYTVVVQPPKPQQPRRGSVTLRPGQNHTLDLR